MSTGHNPAVADFTIGNSEPAQAFPADYPIDLLSGRIADSTVMTAASSPAVGEIGTTGSRVIYWAASAATTAIVNFNFAVPGEYSASRDRLWVMGLVAATTTGNRDLRLQIGRSRQGVISAATEIIPTRTRVYPLTGFTTGIAAESTYTPATDADGDLTPTVSAGTSGLCQLVAWEFEGRGFQPLDALTLVLGPGNTLGTQVNVASLSVRLWRHACIADRAWRGL